MENPADKPFFTSSEDFVAQEQKLLAERRGKTKDSPWLGLALSGGGIRSATFCLGALQALATRGLLGKFDYVSSVSGGGYIACALQWWWTRRDAAGAPKFGSADTTFPYGVNFGLLDRAKLSDNILDYLRTHGRYLTPGDGLTVWSGVSVVLRTLFLNLFVWLSAATLVFCAMFELWPGDKSVPAWINPFPGLIYPKWDQAAHLCGGGAIGMARDLIVEGPADGITTVVGKQANCVLRYALANKGHDTRALQAYLGHKNIQHTVRYTELSPARFKDFWR